MGEAWLFNLGIDRQNLRGLRDGWFGVYWWITTDSVHKVFSSTFEAIPNRRGSHPVRIARMSAIGAGIHAIRAGHHLCD
jgi:hypothetical protein